MNDFKIITGCNYTLWRENIVEHLNQGYTIINVWPQDTGWCAALQKIDPITVAVYANQTWGDR